MSALDDTLPAPAEPAVVAAVVAEVACGDDAVEQAVASSSPINAAPNRFGPENVFTLLLGDDEPGAADRRTTPLLVANRRARLTPRDHRDSPIGPCVRSISMTDPWATSGVDLFVDLDRRRLRTSLESSLRDAIRSGRLHPGTRLPSTRSLAVDLGVARNTVVEVYGQLVAEGWLRATVGSATSVADRSAPHGTQVASSDRPRGGCGTDFDLRGGLPDTSAFPRRAWLAAARRALTRAPDEALGYQDRRGRSELRAALAEYLARVRGVHVHPDQIVICLGAMHGLRLIGKALMAQGARTWATESYGLTWHRQAAVELGLDLRVIDVDDQGARIDQAADADSVLLSPAHQYPLGVALSPQRRQEAIEWAKSTNGMIIEDDYDGEFRHDRRPVGALHSLSPEHVIYVGTASKSLAPALRLGWIAAPPHFLQPLLRAKTISEGHNSTLDQLTLAEFINAGDYDTQVRRNRVRYRRRRDCVVTMLGQFPGLTVAGISAGMHVLVELPPSLDEAEICHHAKKLGLSLEGLSRYAADPDRHPHPPALVIGYGAPSDHAFDEAISRLARTLQHFVR